MYLNITSQPNIFLNKIMSVHKIISDKTKCFHKDQSNRLESPATDLCGALG